jgi:hypothetical protein
MKTPDHNLTNPPPSRETGNKSRRLATLSNTWILGRTALFARVQQASSEDPSPNYPRLMAFLKFWKWFRPYLNDLGRKAAPYRIYPKGQTGIFRLASPQQDGKLKIAVAADWGTGTLESETVAENMKGCSPNYTVHLGDVYYMGDVPEVKENCLGHCTKKYKGVQWPVQNCLGSFALMGNHEMYSGGEGYFRDFISTLGLLNSNGTVKDPQSASYFCLETDRWIVLGLDTGYHSAGFPLLAPVPLINRIPSLNVDARLDEKMLTWLQQTIEALTAAGSANKSILLLTHHQPISSFEPAFTKSARQLAQLSFFNEREFVWLYGHEHRLTVYEKQTIANSLTAHPRCIGHGGMPVSKTHLDWPDPKILYYDPREHPIDSKNPQITVGFNGHVVLIFKDSAMTIEYRDILDNDLLLSETFRPIGSGGLQRECEDPPAGKLARGH